MIGRIPICRRPIHYLGLLRPSLRSAQISPIAERRLKHGMDDSGEESSAKAHTRLRQVKSIKVRQSFCKKENPARDGAATSGLMTQYVGHAKEESMSEAKDELTSGAKNDSMCEETKVPLSDSKNEPISETNDSPQSDAKDEPFTTEVPQERRQESPFECRPELPMKGQPATPTQPYPAVVNPKNPYPVVTCQQDQDAVPSSSEASEGKVKISGKIIFKDNSQLETKACNILSNEAPSTKGESMNVWAQSYASDAMDPAKKDSKVDSAAMQDKKQIILEFETQASKTEGNNPSSEKPNEIVEGKQQKTEELYPTTPKGYEIGCVIDFSNGIQISRDSAGKAEQVVEAETENLEDTIKTSSTAEHEEKPAKAIQEVEEVKNSKDIDIKSPTNSLPIKIVRNEDGSPVDPPPIITRIPSSELKSDKDVSPEESSSSKYKRNLEFIQTEPVLTSDGEMKLVEPTSVDLSLEPSMKKATEMTPEVEEFQSKTNELQSEIKELQSEATEQKSEATTTELESKELQSEVKELQSEATEQKSEATTKESKSKELQSKATEQKSEATTNDSRSKELQSKATEQKSEATTNESKSKELQSEMKELQSEATEQKSEATTNESKSKELQSEVKELQSEATEQKSEATTNESKSKEFQSEMKELQSKATEQKSESKEAVSASKMDSQNTPKSAAEIISMLELKQKAMKSISHGSTLADPPIKSTSQIVATFGLRPEPGQGFRAKGTLNNTELDRQADEYFAKINEHETSQLEKKMEPETSKIESKIESETSKLVNIMEPESSQLPKIIEPVNSQLENKMGAKTLLPESKVDQVETPEESNRKAEEYFENIAELEISQLDRQMEESKSSTFEELSAISKTDKSSELETKVEDVQNPNEPKEYATFKAMVKQRKADEYFAKINEAEISQLDGKIEPESTQLDGKMETKSQEKSKSFEDMSTEGNKEQTDNTDQKNTSKEMNPDVDIDDNKVEDKKELPSDRPLFVPADDKDRLLEKSELTGGELYKPQSEDPMSDDYNYDSNPTTDKNEKKEKPRSKPKLEDGELDVKLLVPDKTTNTASGIPETTAAPAKQNFVQYIFGKIFRKEKKTPPADRTMSTDCQRRDLNTSSTLLYPEHDDILDDPYSPEVGKVINPDDKDFISPDLERQGLGATTIHEERYDQPQAMKKDNPVGVWSIIKLKAPLNTQPSKKMSMAMPILRFASDDKGSLKIRSASPQCKNREKTVHEELMEKKENQENKTEILGDSEQCAEKMEKLKKEPKDDDCKRSFSSYFEGFTKMFWSSSISDADPSKKDK
ncbi:neurofilament heavy polypeptide isoform X2 [Drosophila guanche]|uniref:neurofilament heavy polypeptide isoform X2 n=1 Tax=Drosophila guanche TaxID=7266 RepID=UPI001471900B|nr:neurofilament heavy polypeptide isoform X2 [Drosophila guanche]